MITFPTATKDARAQAVVDAADVGTANASAQLWIKDSGDNVLAKLVMSNPAFLSVTNGVSIADTITDGIGLLAGGASKFTVVDRDEAEVFSGEIGAVGSGSDLESGTSSVTIAVGETVSCSGLTYIEAS